MSGPPSASCTFAPSKPVTTMIRPGASSRAARSTCAAIGSPVTGCNTFGRPDFIRVPLPAASTITHSSALIGRGLGAMERSYVWEVRWQYA